MCSGLMFRACPLAGQRQSEIAQKNATRSERCNLVKYLYPVIYWRLYKFRAGVRDRSYNMHEITIVVSYWNC